MTPHLAAVLESATIRERVDIVLKLMADTGPDAEFARIWKALADIVSDWEPGMKLAPFDSRLVIALADVDDWLVAYLAARLAGSTNAIRRALAREVIGARMHLIQATHDVHEAMRVQWPGDNCGESAG